MKVQTRLSSEKKKEYSSSSVPQKNVELGLIGFLRGGGDSPNLPSCSLGFPNLPGRNPQDSPGTPPPLGHPGP